MALPKHTTRKGAASGEPSFIWIGKSGRYYRNIVHAKIDNPANAIQKPNTQATSKTKNIFIAIIAILVVLIVIKIIK